MSFTFRIGVFYAFQLITCLTWAQERCLLHLSGQIVNGDNGNPIVGASVFVGDRHVVSDPTGQYDFHQICPGTYQLRCILEGFKPLNYTLILNESRIENIKLHSDTCELPSVVIRGKRNRHTTQVSQTIQSERKIALDGLSLGEQLKEIEGVHVVQTGPTIFKPVVQGLSGQRVVILNNGIRQESQQWGSEHAPEIDPFIFEKISLLKGASSVRYGGDALGGVILLEPKSYRKQNGLEGAIQSGYYTNNRMYTNAGRLEATYGSFSGRVQGSIRNAGDSKAPDYVMSNTGFQEYNYSYSLAFQKRKFGTEVFYSQFNTKVGILSAAHIGNLTDLNRAIASDQPLVIDNWTREIKRPYQLVSHELFKVQSFARPTSWLKLIANYSLQYNDRKEYDKLHAYNNSDGNAELEMNITTQMVNASAEHNFHAEHQGALGIFYSNQENISLGRPFIPNYKGNTYAAYLTESWHHKRIQVEIGSRYEVRDMTSFFYLTNVYQSPSRKFENLAFHLNGSYEIRQNLKLFGNFSSGFRTPHVSELYSNGVHHGTAAVEIGDSLLTPEKAISTSLSLPFLIKKMQGEIMVYHNRIDDFIYLAPSFPATLTIRGAFPTFRYTQTQVHFTGVDFSLRDTMFGAWVPKFKGSILDSRIARTREVLFMSPPTRLEFELRYLFKEKNKRQNTYVALNVQKTFSKQLVDESLDYAAPPSGYILYNMETGTKLIQQKTTIWIHAGVHNIFNTSYRDYMDRFRYYTDSPGRNIYLKLKFEFNRDNGNKKSFYEAINVNT